MAPDPSGFAMSQRHCCSFQTIGCALAHGAAAVLSRMARRLIGGQTGDILGAAQQLAEIAIYLGLALAIAWPGR